MFLSAFLDIPFALHIYSSSKAIVLGISYIDKLKVTYNYANII